MRGACRCAVTHVFVADKLFALCVCFRPGSITVDIRRKHVLEDSMAAFQRFKVRTELEFLDGLLVVA